MKTKTIFEEEILKEIQDLPESMQEKLAKIVYFLKKEIIRSELNEKNATMGDNCLIATKNIFGKQVLLCIHGQY